MKSIYQAGMLLVVITIIAGIFYPALVTGIGQLLWSEKSNGSLIQRNNEVIGSLLIAQSFKDPKYFWPRPSASNFSALPSGASNLGPTSAALKESIAKRRIELSKDHNMAESNIPLDLLTTSASGLDPHISVDAARIQVKRIAAARGLNTRTAEGTIHTLIDSMLERPQFFILGEERINVLSLNLGLDICCK